MRANACPNSSPQDGTWRAHHDFDCSTRNPEFFRFKSPASSSQHEFFGTPTQLDEWSSFLIYPAPSIQEQHHFRHGILPRLGHELDGSLPTSAETRKAKNRTEDKFHIVPVPQTLTILSIFDVAGRHPHTSSTDGLFGQMKESSVAHFFSWYLKLDIMQPVVGHTRYDTVWPQYGNDDHGLILRVARKGIFFCLVSRYNLLV